MTCDCSGGGIASPVPRQDIAIKQGSDLTINFVMPGSPVPDITGWSFEFVARAYVGDTTAALQFGTVNASPDSRIVVTDGPAGEYSVIFVNANTIDLVPSECGVPSLLYDIKATDASGLVTYPVQGYVYVSASIN